MSDTIYRQQAIDAIEEMQMPIMRSEWLSDQYKFSALGEVRQIIEDLPSAQPERKMGKWMPVSDETQTWHYCSECHYQQYEKTKFCPSCGADMDGGKSE